MKLCLYQLLISSIYILIVKETSMLAKLLIEILKVNERLSILFTYIDIIHSDCMQYEQLINVPAQMKIQIFRYNELFSNI